MSLGYLTGSGAHLNRNVPFVSCILLIVVVVVVIIIFILAPLTSVVFCATPGAVVVRFIGSSRLRARIRLRISSALDRIRLCTVRSGYSTPSLLISFATFLVRELGIPERNAKRFPR